MNVEPSQRATRRPPFVVLAGNLGAGKTTLAKRLGDHFGWWVGYESVNDNPYLDDFYKDMAGWGFHLQVYFLANRLRLHTEAVRKSEGAVLDRSIYEDRHIFAEMLHRQGFIPEREFRTYVELFEATVRALPQPDLFILLSCASTPVLKKRIAGRAQPFDRELPAEYLDRVRDQYQVWSQTLPAERLLVIDAESANFAADDSNAPGMAAIFSRISGVLESLDEKQRS